ncbi:MAG: hypothetical protein IJY18_01290 [Clostridia bacterium]|nr:hypothetical protein [Clostridia bacterium]
MSDLTILQVEYTDSDGKTVWVNPAHIVKVVRNSFSDNVVHLSNGDTFHTDYSGANKIKAYFDDAQKKLL